MLTENLMTYRELKHKAKEQLKTGTNRRDLYWVFLTASGSGVRFRYGSLPIS